MHAIILIGGSLQKQNYIQQFVEENNIPSYNIISFSENLKISDAREIVKALNFTTNAGRKRLVLINKDPNTEAQNALLKTLEELDQDTDFIFAGDKELLSTVISRCQVIKLTEDQGNAVSVNKEIMGVMKDGETGEKLLAIENLFTDKNEKVLESLILQLRAQILGQIISDKFVNIAEYKIFKLLNSNAHLSASNNLNPRLQLEKILLTT